MKYAVILYGKRGKVQTLNFTAKTRVPRTVQVQKYAKGTLRVVYDSRKDLWNEGEFTDYKSFMSLWSAFTERALMEYVKKW